MSNLGDKIKEIRISQGLSQEDLAKELGYTSRSTIAKIEKGVNEISFDKLQLLLKKYDLEMNELFDDFAHKVGGKIISNDNHKTTSYVKSIISNYNIDKLSFKEIDDNNFYDVCNLEVKEEQQDFVASNVMSLAECYLFEKKCTWVLPLAIYNDNDLIGFLMITKGNIGVDTPKKYENSFCILRMMIDKRYQGNGYGYKILKQIINLLKSISNPNELIWISTEKENASAISLYNKVGFKLTNDLCGEEIILTIDIK